MPERYIDPNSGAAPQPGGFAHRHVLKNPEKATASTPTETDAKKAKKALDEQAKKAASLESASPETPSVGPNTGEATETGEDNGPVAPADDPEQAPGTATTEPPSRVGPDGVPVLEDKAPAKKAPAKKAPAKKAAAKKAPAKKSASK